MEDLLNNFYIFIPIAIVIALRILEARKKQAGSGTAQPLFQGRQRAASSHGEAAGAPEQGSSSRPPAEETPVPLPPKPSPGRDRRTPAAVPAAGVPAAPLTRQSFPGNLDHLPPLKRAVALTEILGPPRGMAI